MSLWIGYALLIFAISAGLAVACVVYPGFAVVYSLLITGVWCSGAIHAIWGAEGGD